MRSIKPISVLLILGLLFLALGCGSNQSVDAEDTEAKKEAKKEQDRGEKTEHKRDVGEKSEGEESGEEFSKNQTYDKVRNGARLQLQFDSNTNAFVGTVTNTTNKNLSKVRVEVHLSNGTELGPTKPKDLAPGKKIAINLKSTEKPFDKWSAHPETGSDEHGNEGENHEEENEESENEKNDEADESENHN